MKFTRKAIQFMLLTCLVSWGAFYAYLGLGGPWTNTSATIVLALYMFFPLLVAWGLQRFVYEEKVAEPLSISFNWNKWFWVAGLVPLGLALAAFGVSLLLPEVVFSPDMAGLMDRFEGMLSPGEMEEAEKQLEALPVHAFWISMVQAVVAGFTINAFFAFGEEMGWRGFLYKELAPNGFWSASLITGIVWGIWHFPAILKGHNYPDHPEWGVGMMVLFCIGFSPLFTLIRYKSGSVIAAAILHGAINASAGLAIMLIQGGSDLLVGITGLAGLIVLAVTNLVIFFTRTSWDPDHRFPSI